MERKNEQALIVFVKNPVEGQVKTRLAAEVGNEKALSVYNQLMEHTRQVAMESDADVHVFYSDYVDQDDHWLQTDFSKHQQEGEDLGSRMLNAFKTMDNLGYQKKIIIGSDCPEITAEIINDAFSRLDEYDFVLGPALDGGYYLLGMQEILDEVFREISWSSDQVFDQTIATLQNVGMVWYEMPMLSDVDKEDDLPKMRKITNRPQLSE